jgi:glycosyltransferase involved in cell wall biosynthesis
MPATFACRTAINGDNEGGMVFIEAAACGNPRWRAGGGWFAVLNEVTGLRVDGATRDAVTAGLRRLLIEPEWAASLGHAGLNRVATEFSWSRVAEKTRAHASGKRC